MYEVVCYFIKLTSMDNCATVYNEKFKNNTSSIANTTCKKLEVPDNTTSHRAIKKCSPRVDVWHVPPAEKRLGGEKKKMCCENVTLFLIGCTFLSLRCITCPGRL